MISSVRPIVAGHATRMLFRGAAAALLLALLTACAESTAPEQNNGESPYWDPSQDQIFFVSTRAGGVDAAGQPLDDIYRVNADGTGVQRLTEESAAYRDLQLSPDGARLAYYSDQAGCYNIWVMKLDGTDATQLTSLNGLERCNEMPRWSPDGTRIAFQSSRNPDLGWDVYVMNADGTDVVNVSNNPSTDFATNRELVMGWSPDGRVVMQSNRDGSDRTYLVNADGSGLEPLFEDTYAYPSWSPNGTKVAVTKDSDVYVVNADGTSSMNLSDDPAFDTYVPYDPWSPDGSRLAFRSLRTGEAEIYVVNVDGTGLTDVTNSPGSETFLGWSPDGSRILFVGTRTGDNEIYVMNADGTGVVNVSNGPAADDDRAIWVPKR